MLSGEIALKNNHYYYYYYYINVKQTILEHQKITAFAIIILSDEKATIMLYICIENVHFYVYHIYIYSIFFPLQAIRNIRDRKFQMGFQCVVFFLS